MPQRLRFLLDINVLIPLQDSLQVRQGNLANFVRLANIGGHQLMYHPAYPDLYTPKPKFFSTLLLAIQLGKQVDIEYRSLTTPHPHRRTMSLRSLVRAVSTLARALFATSKGGGARL